MELRTEEMLLNIGPQHPSTHGVFRVVVKVDGEKIVEATPVVGYLHRGTEKIAESLTYTQIIPYTDRLDYLSSMLNNYALVQAVEELMNIEVPERAEYLRVIVMELSRLASHFVWWGTAVLDLGATTPFIFAFRDRELILDLLNEISGARMTFNYMRVGGVKWDAPEGWLEKVRDFIPYMRKKLKEYHQLVTGNEIFLARVKNLAVYDGETAIKYGLSGPNLRGSNVKFDIRKNQPYSIYDRFEFEIPVGENGDVFDRYMVRMKEMEQSLKIIEQAVDQIPEGEIQAKLPRVLRVPEGEVYTRMETSKGELGIHLVSKGKDKPYRLHFRRPSFINLQIFSDLLVGNTMADLPAILGAIDIVLGEVDA
ncbi:NADH dehydrogenase [Vulcanibacillus modesticaldus]|uniref:NADH-quinone oxidoreductase subunit D n=1 Tax=Vulcanibacillus modesticaldus TaxID=337097 RepID=A0A1D2YW27_9BACI|nr:NADH-quinone oxidoreductase subunit D [Vulcanibacillus modesticaldus]OEF99825.1 NADH dehydrogenase [Vulcanibacillus modesticaldus]